MKHERMAKKPYTREDLEVLLDRMPFLAWLKDEESRYIYVNEAYAKLAKAPKEEMIGKQDTDYWTGKELYENHLNDEEVMRTRLPKIYEIGRAHV